MLLLFVCMYRYTSSHIYIHTHTRSLPDAESGEDDVEDVLRDVVPCDGPERQRRFPELYGPKVNGKTVVLDVTPQASQRCEGACIASACR